MSLPPQPKSSRPLRAPTHDLCSHSSTHRGSEQSTDLGERSRSDTVLSAASTATSATFASGYGVTATATSVTFASGFEVTGGCDFPADTLFARRKLRRHRFLAKLQSLDLGADIDVAFTTTASKSKTKSKLGATTATGVGTAANPSAAALSPSLGTAFGDYAKPFRLSRSSPTQDEWTCAALFAILPADAIVTVLRCLLMENSLIGSSASAQCTYIQGPVFLRYLS